MAWPPPVFDTNFTNATPQLDTHPDTHVALATSLNEDFRPQLDWLASRPKGLIAYKVLTNFTSTVGRYSGGVEDAPHVSGLSLGWQRENGRRYRWEFSCQARLDSNNTADDWGASANVVLRWGTSTSLQVVQRADANLSNPATGHKRRHEPTADAPTVRPGRRG